MLTSLEAYPYQTVFLNRLQYDITSDWCLESTRAEDNAETDAFRGTLRLHTADTQDLENKKEGSKSWSRISRSNCIVVGFYGNHSWNPFERQTLLEHGRVWTKSFVVELVRNPLDLADYKI